MTNDRWGLIFFMAAASGWDYLIDDMRAEIRAKMNRGQRLALSLTSKREIALTPPVPGLIKSLVKDRDMEALCFAIRAIYSDPFMMNTMARHLYGAVRRFATLKSRHQFGQLLCYATQYWPLDDVRIIEKWLRGVPTCFNTRVKLGSPGDSPLADRSLAEACRVHACCHKPLYPCAVRTCDSLACDNVQLSPSAKCGLHGPETTGPVVWTIIGRDYSCGHFCSEHASMVKCITCDTMICMRYNQCIQCQERGVTNPFIPGVVRYIRFKTDYPRETK